MVDLFGGPLDGQRRRWSEPLPPEIRFPAFRRVTYYVEEGSAHPIPMRVLVYRHRSLGRYDFVREEA